MSRTESEMHRHRRELYEALEFVILDLKAIARDPDTPQRIALLAAFSAQNARDVINRCLPPKRGKPFGAKYSSQPISSESNP